MKIHARKLAIAIFVLATPIAALASPFYQSWGSLPAATFGGTGIPNNAVASAVVITGNGTDKITLALSATGRYSNPATTTDNAGTYYAGAGSNCGVTSGPCPGSLGALWNFDFYVNVASTSGSTLGTYTYQLYYDFNPAINTPLAQLGQVNGNNALYGEWLAGGSVGTNPLLLQTAQDSQNLMFSQFTTGYPSTIFPPISYPTFNPNAPGEYSFYLVAQNSLGITLGAVGINVDVVPVPGALWLFPSALGLLGLAKRRQVTV